MNNRQPQYPCINRANDCANSGKVTSLESAIKDKLKPGMSLYVGYGANASLREIYRQYRGTKPNFTLIIPATSFSAIHLVHEGLVKKMITVYYGAGQYPGPSPSPIIQKSHQDKKVELEEWGLLSLALRLMAGAMGLPFMPTRSLSGSSLAERNKHAFSTLRNPFPGDPEIGVVAQLRPDVALVHGWAADCSGHSIMAPAIENGMDSWGIKASNFGAIVTVEKVESDEFMRKHAVKVNLPAQYVTAVCPAPLGAHPDGMLSVGLPGLRGYEYDFDFIRRCRKASSEPRSLEEWVREWVLDCSHDDYVHKLGARRVSALRKSSLASTTHLRPLRVRSEEELRDDEIMQIAAAREIISAIVERGRKVILSGVGIPGLASRLAYHQLKRKGYDVELMIGTGFIGYEPPSGEHFPLRISSLATSRVISDVINTYGVLVGGPRSVCLSVLGAAQVDRYGNLNSSMTEEGICLVGAGGANDAANAPEVILVIPQFKTRFVKKLNYVTSPGMRVRALISNMGVFQKNDPSGELVLVRYFPWPDNADCTKAIARIKRNCGWPLRVAPDVKALSRPTDEELALLTEVAGD